MSRSSVKPAVSIGMPVYNGEAHIRNALDSLLAQTFVDFELIVSDNASTDLTGEICKEYAARDARIRYVRQSTNIGATANFRFVLKAATADYYMWAAADDARSPDFLHANYLFLQTHHDYVASTSPVRFEGGEFDPIKMGDAALDEDDANVRVIKPFSVWHANGRFYSLFCRKYVLQWPHLENQEFLGSDWTLATHLASVGKCHRHIDGWVTLGTKGMSSKPELYTMYPKRRIEWFLPFYKVSLDAMRHIEHARIGQKIVLLWRLFKLNRKALKVQNRALRRLRKSANKIPTQT